MTEPRIDDATLGDLRFRGPIRSNLPTSTSPGNFWLGVAIFLGVALVYPFYSHEVQSRLAARDVEAAVSEFTGQMDTMADDAQRQLQLAARDAAAQAAANRQRAVVVLGSTTVGGDRVVIVHLGQATMAEAQPSICRQAATQFGNSLSGEILRVQRHRGSRPAVDAGTIRCD
ncbi:hypothetical protein [Arenimonas sp. MALMAid1274]|uniref:hypothetical protein n=1 Tax=Arenimonas sp. MALMAid1274 TaxID=3411630 RepID=UPI003BA25B73